MSNWVYNQVHVDGPAGALDELVLSDESGFDFERIAPVPAELVRPERPFDGTTAVFAWLAAGMADPTLDDVKAAHPEEWALLLDSTFFPDHLDSQDALDEALAEAMALSPEDYSRAHAQGAEQIGCLRRHGCDNAYMWRIMNWGCKWNASEVSGEGNHRCFDTPWGAPLPVLMRLAHRCKSPMVASWCEEQMVVDSGVLVSDGDGTVHLLQARDEAGCMAVNMATGAIDPDADVKRVPCLGYMTRDDYEGDEDWFADRLEEETGTRPSCWDDVPDEGPGLPGLADMEWKHMRFATNERGDWDGETFEMLGADEAVAFEVPGLLR